MENNKDGKKSGEIWVKDIATVATLSYFGQPIRDIQEDYIEDKYTGEKKPFSHFVFKDIPEVDKIISDFNQDRAVVNPRRFSIVFREVKSRLYESKNRLKLK